jgi:hypothetical protein
MALVPTPPLQQQNEEKGNLLLAKRREQQQQLQLPSPLFDPKPRQQVLRVIENKPSCAELLFSNWNRLASNQDSTGGNNSSQQWKGPTIKVLENVEVDRFVENAQKRLFLY